MPLKVFLAGCMNVAILCHLVITPSQNLWFKAANAEAPIEEKKSFSLRETLSNFSYTQKCIYFFHSIIAIGLIKPSILAEAATQRESAVYSSFEKTGPVLRILSIDLLKPIIPL